MRTVAGRVVAVVLAILGARMVGAQGLSVAVLDLQPVGVSPESASAAGEVLRTEFVKHPLFAVVERGRLGELLTEQSIQLSGLTESSTAVQVGEMLNVRKLVFGSLASVKGQYVKYLLTVRLVDVQTASIEAAETVDVPTDDALRAACGLIVEKVAAAVSIVGEVGAVDGETLYVSLGAAMGVSPGTLLDVFVVDLVRDRSGDILFREERAAGMLRVVAAEESGSKCEVVRKVVEIGEGMLVRPAAGEFALGVEDAGTGTVTLVSVPPGAKAYLGRELVGLAPVTVPELGEGRYTVELRLPGYRSYVGRLTVTPGRSITVERALDKVVEIEDVLEGQALRRPTDPRRALAASLIPGGGEYYNGYEATAIFSGVQTGLGLGAAALFVYNGLSNKADEEGISTSGVSTASTFWDIQEYHSHRTESGYRFVDAAFLGGFALLTYAYAALDGVLSAPSAVRTTEYVEVRLGGQAYLHRSSQTSDTMVASDRTTWNPGTASFEASAPTGVYQNPWFDEMVSAMGGSDLGGGLSLGLRSRRFCSTMELAFGPETVMLAFSGRLRIPLVAQLSADLGAVYLTNQSTSANARIPAPGVTELVLPFPKLSDVGAPTVGLALELPRMLLELEYSPVAMGSAALYLAKDASDMWAEPLIVGGLRGHYGRIRADWYPRARFGVSVEARYILFTGMWDNQLADLGASVLDWHGNLFVSVSPVFRF